MSIDDAWRYFPWICVFVLLVSVLSIIRRSRNHGWLQEVQLSLISQPRSSIVVGVVAFLGILVTALFGAGLMDRYPEAWGMLVLAAAGLIQLAFYAWIALRPFQWDGEDLAGPETD